MKSAKIFGSDFNRLVESTKNFVSSINTRAAHQFIRLEFSAQEQRVTAIAVDGYRMAVEHSVVSDCDEDFTAYIKPTFRLPKGEYAIISTDDEVLQVSCNGVLFGFEQPKAAEFLDWGKVIPSGEPTFEIGFNGNYLLDALKAAKTSAGSFKNPVVFKFWSPVSPAIIQTNKDDIKMVLPIRINKN